MIILKAIADVVLEVALDGVQTGEVEFDRLEDAWATLRDLKDMGLPVGRLMSAMAKWAFFKGQAEAGQVMECLDELDMV